MLLAPLAVKAQQFYNLTADEVRIDSVLPSFSCSMPLPANYSDSVYTVKILYPEFIDMTPADIAAYNSISGAALPALPEVEQCIVVERKRGRMECTFCPLVYREGRYRMLVSFMLKLQSSPLSAKARRAKAANRADAATPAQRYASSSVLASGKWAKIRVPSTGVYQLTDALVRSAGFSSLSKVKIYGYGGNMQNETLNGDELTEQDDLKEVPTCTVSGRRLFYAKGPVSWSGNGQVRRTRNPYSDYGYYFLTESDGEPASVDSTEFISSFYPSSYYYHTLYEVDGYSWFEGGRNLYDTKQVALGTSQTISIEGNKNATMGQFTVNVSAGTASTVQVSVNDSVVGNINISVDATYAKGGEKSISFRLRDIKSVNEVKILPLSGGPVRLDYVDVAWDQPQDCPSLTSSSMPVPEYVYNITNQNHHADQQAAMVIIIPTSQKLLAQAERLKAFHEQHDGMKVNIVPADELYNEFSSGTPDASAYRRYLKMLYDRATTDAEAPRYLLLFGDCVWDNRLLTESCRHLDADDLLLCHESENSFSEIYCYVDDGFYCYLDDGEGASPDAKDKLDMAVGRFPVTTAEQAKVMVDKTINYANNQNAGAWQNTLVFMGDDGNNNLHMRDENEIADDISSQHPAYTIKKIMWDAYTRQSSSTGYTYPEVTRLIKQYQQQGALIMDYAGHGSQQQISHESALRITDFSSFTNTNLPLWITASCMVMPFDGVSSTIGEEAVLNSKGGAVAFFGTTRTVYTNYNKAINKSYLTHVLTIADGKPVTMGEAQRLAKNEMITSKKDLTVNKLQYSLLGDPALALALPQPTVVIDSINGAPVSSSSPTQLKAGTVATLSGHISNADTFAGTATLTVLDSREKVTCRMNDADDEDGADSAFEFYDRSKTIYSGTSTVSAGRFSFRFAVPKDINYSDSPSLANVFAVNSDKSQSAHGYTNSLVANGSDLAANDSIGPSIYCYLNSPSFVNGGKVNSTPYFVANVTDQDGINATGNGIGHDLQLVIDGQQSLTYNLNDNFEFDFGSYTSGTTHYSLPELSVGKHTLTFRAWDVLNNSSTAELSFVVTKGLQPNIFSVSCTNNPASTSTSFVINHDRTGSTVDVDIDVFDMSGRHLWTHSESGVSTDSAYTVDWDLTVDTGAKLQTGVYLYRARISSEGSSKASKAHKLIVVTTK